MGRSNGASGNGFESNGDGRSGIKAVFVDIDGHIGNKTEERLYIPAWREWFKKSLGRYPKDKIPVQNDGLEGINELFFNLELPPTEVGMLPRDIMFNVEMALMRNSLKLKHPDEHRIKKIKESVKPMVDEDEEIFSQLLLEGVSKFDVEANPGALELLRGCKEAGLPVIAITSSYGKYGHELLVKLGVRKYVGEIISGDKEVTDGEQKRRIKAKPDSEPFNIALNLLNEGRKEKLKPHNVVMSGDSWNSDVKGALGAGMWAIWLTDKESATKKRKEVNGEFAKVLHVESLVHINPRPGRTFEGYPFNKGFLHEGKVLTSSHAGETPKNIGHFLGRGHRSEKV